MNRLITAVAGLLFCTGICAQSLPQVFLDTTYAPPPGKVIPVNAGGNLQSAIDRAEPGDTILLQSGASFNGPITLRDKGPGTEWIYVRSSGAIPPPGNRVTPADAGMLATIIGNGKPVIALQTQGAAHHYRFVGIEFKPGPGLFATSLVRVGASETAVAALPHHIVFDRCYIHGDPVAGGRRGVMLNGASSAVIDSYLSDWKDAAADSQAIAAWNTPGPLKIANTHLEAAGENVMFGGADPSIANLVPSDIEVRGNLFTKPLAWRSKGWVVKNLFETKNARRILVEGNIFENHWAAAQDFALNIKASNQEGKAPWSVIEDFTFRNNIVRHVPNAMKFCARSCDGSPTPQGSRFRVQNNIFHDVSSATWGGDGVFLQTGGAVPELVVRNNTVIHDGSLFNGGDSGDNPGFQFVENIVQRGPYGFKGSGKGEGMGTLSAFFPGAVFTKNVIAGGSAGSYPAGNHHPASYAGVGFVDLAAGDYRLSPSSAYRGAGADGKDLGADVSAVNAATRCAATGQCAR